MIVLTEAAGGAIFFFFYKFQLLNEYTSWGATPASPIAAFGLASKLEGKDTFQCSGFFR